MKESAPLKKGDGGLSGVVTRPAPPGSPLATLLDSQHWAVAVDQAL